MDGKREMLRHTVATVAYRAAKAIGGAPAGFESFRAGDTSRTAGQILAHIGDLFDWGLSLAKGAETWRESPPLTWDRGMARVFDAIGRFDTYLAGDSPLACAPEQLFQGPIADALTHIGQIAMLRRLAGSAVRGENYQRAAIAVGRVGPQQDPPTREFD